MNEAVKLRSIEAVLDHSAAYGTIELLKSSEQEDDPFLSN